MNPRCTCFQTSALPWSRRASGTSARGSARGASAASTWRRARANPRWRCALGASASSRVSRRRRLWLRRDRPRSSPPSSPRSTRRRKRWCTTPSRARGLPGRGSRRRTRRARWTDRQSITAGRAEVSSPASCSGSRAAATRTRGAVAARRVASGTWCATRWRKGRCGARR